jgi:2-polyprenyl-6-methoxyphenol hydroxylase-like FAD-dependent oxidoreductase
VETLSHLVLRAQAGGQDIASATLLHTYERRHRLETKPLYLITLAIAKLYTTESLPAQFLRTAALHVGQWLMPFKRAVAASIAGKG